MYHMGSMPAQVDAEALALLAEAETATIGHFRHMGFMHRAIQALRPGRVVGTAVTLALPGLDSTLLHHALSDVRPGDILVIDRLGDDRHACWGGGVTRAAKAAGVVAAIIDGPCTDPSEIIEEAFPLWSRGPAPITTRVLDLGGGMNVPVSCGGAVVLPGDAILADESGVIVLRPEEVRATAEEAIRRQERGKIRQAEIASGRLKIGDASGARAKVEAALAAGR
ncbi:RraA family protein [Arsenicitalea aurantiaca]|uniref:Putative 4-hydroxy-4-methyl-2-oxoglutarate aldolase n=1 Tax=Arsenicitalea aurantiaca TaxID=1783274 RepID=A0A433XLV1_9HYPH|nr:RraA family protein [Arsenicitalea aurantiaca]RUT35051.1 RraA family protein [Arsenicitalea aurantiaca]